VEVANLDHGRSIWEAVFGADDEAVSVDGGQRVDGDVKSGELNVGIKAERESGDDSGFQGRPESGDVEAEKDAATSNYAEQEPEEKVASSLRHPIRGYRIRG
jgi:hypothetical protein